MTHPLLTAPTSGRCSPLAAQLADIVAARRAAARASQLEVQDLVDLIASIGESAASAADEIVQISSPANRLEAEALSASQAAGPTCCPVVIPDLRSPLPVRELRTHASPSRAPTLTTSLPGCASPQLPPTSWAKTPGAAKFERSFAVAQAEAGVAFTLNLSPGRETALRKSRDPARALGAFIQRAFARLLGDVPLFGFALQVSPEGRLHAHGVYIPGNFIDRTKVGGALRASGGALKGHAASRQVCLRAIFDGAGWARYVTRGARATCLDLGIEKITFLSAGLRALTRDSWSGKATCM